jgi:hypothetical protein
LGPTNLRITKEYYEKTSLTVTLEWDTPQGMDPVATVDYYTFTFFPPLMSQSGPITSPWNATLQYNVNYSISVASENCAGQSTTLSFKYGKY